MITTLKAGGQFVGYQGSTLLYEQALASILPYVGEVWASRPDGTDYKLTAADSLSSGRAYWIEVSQDCTWVYDKVEISSIALYAGWNLVAYPGPTRSVEAAVASILPYVVNVWWYSPAGEWYTYSPGWPGNLVTLVNGEAYQIRVTQDCVWTWEEAVAAGTITLYDFWNPDTGAWQTTAPALLVGDTLTLRGHARNDSGAQMRGRMDAEVTDPSGNVSTLHGAVGTMEASGAEQHGTWTFSILVDEPGTWGVELILYGELV